MKHPILSIIIVSYNTKALTAQAIQSALETDSELSREIIVVDNDSNDGSAKELRERFGSKIKIIEAKKNLGFAAANNLGATHAEGEWYFFLNPDTILQQGSLKSLLETANRTPNLGAISGCLHNGDGTIQQQGGALPTLGNVFAWMFFFDDLPGIRRFFPAYQQRQVSYFRHSRKTGWIGGTALLVSSKVFDRLRGWDEGIQLYGEDVELCLRMKKLELDIWLESSAKIIHLKHQSSTSSSSWVVGEMTGLLYIWKKHFPAWQVPVLRAVLYIGSWLRVILFGILIRDEDRYTAYLKAQARVLVA